MKLLPVFSILAIIIIPNDAFVRVSYSLWIGSIADRNTLLATLPDNSTFYQLMQIGEEIYPVNFKFEAIDYPGLGHYITSIGGHAQDPENNVYWMLYVLDDLPDLKDPPGDAQLSPLGVDSLILEHEKSYLFWLHEYIYTNKTN